MSSTDITVKDCFLRTSDDCVAIYGRRWDYNADSRNITVSSCCLWADVAHPTVIGTHGDYEHDGNVLEDIRFEDLDMVYEDIRIEPFQRGKLLDIQVKRNPDYNPVPGGGIAHIRFKNITYTGCGEVKSCIRGYDAEHIVSDVTIENLSIRGKKAESLAEAGIETGPFAKEIRLLS